MIRRKVGGTEYWKPEALTVLKQQSCPVCKRLIEEVPRDFFWFVNEKYYEVETIVRLQRSYGFCPNHVRHLLKTGHYSVITTVFLYQTGYAIRRLQAARSLLSYKGLRQDSRDQCREAATAIRREGECPTCRGLHWQNDYVINIILRTLRDPEVQSLYQKSAGFCLPHFLRAGLAADWASLSVLAEHMRGRLRALAISNRPTADLFEQVAGLDKDRSVRQQDGKHRPSDLIAKRKEPIALTPNQQLGAYAAVPWSPTFERGCTAIAEPDVQSVSLANEV